MSYFLLTLTIVGGAFSAWVILVALFTPHLPYHIEADVDASSDHFIRVLEASLQTTMTIGNAAQVLTNGAQFYPAMLAAIRSARRTVHLEAYIFEHGRIGRQFIEALADRARHGVRVTIVLDAIGTLGNWRAIRDPLRAAGCRVSRYQRATWYRLARLNNRTHREILVVDGQVAFAGGAGIADRWIEPDGRHPAWRDMMVRFEGPIVTAIQGIFAENWLECRGEILTGPESYSDIPPVGRTPAFAMRSSPSDRATSSRVLFQTLVEGANERIAIGTPYFLPDKAFREAFIRTATRGVAITVVVPGPDTDQRWVRLASRRMYGRLLEAGVRIFEYHPGMTHAKYLLVDDVWASIGTTNLDNRSFEHNDEINVVLRDREVNARIRADFEADLAHSREVTLEAWRQRPVWEKLIGAVAWILERQQ
ncbi:MAG: phosphatidylserine/phosphatidylglycerophosphate/cardiolipin synthase family protein [Vicinamibacterales bacterium]